MSVCEVLTQKANRFNLICIILRHYSRNPLTYDQYILEIPISDQYSRSVLIVSKILRSSTNLQNKYRSKSNLKMTKILIN